MLLLLLLFLLSIWLVCVLIHLFSFSFAYEFGVFSLFHCLFIAFATFVYKHVANMLRQFVALHEMAQITCVLWVFLLAKGKIAKILLFICMYLLYLLYVKYICMYCWQYIYTFTAIHRYISFISCQFCNYFADLLCCTFLYVHLLVYLLFV